MQNDQVGLWDKSFCCPWNMGEIGGLNSGAVVESQVVLLYSSKKFNFRFMDWADLKIQTRCHFQSLLRQWGSILCLNQETYLLFSESSSVNISQSLSQSQLQKLMDLCMRFILSRYIKKKSQKSHLLCYMLSIAPTGFTFIPVSVSSLAVSYFSLSPVFRVETVFVVTSCQRCLGLSIGSNGEEAAWFFFFCDTVIRHPPSPSSSNAMQKISKYCLQWLKTAHYLWLLCLMQAPTEQRVQPEKKKHLSSKRGPAFDKFLFLSSPSSSI